MKIGCNAPQCQHRLDGAYWTVTIRTAYHNRQVTGGTSGSNVQDRPHSRDRRGTAFQLVHRRRSVHCHFRQKSQYPDTYPDWTETQYWTVALASVLLLFLSVLLHEFGHALVAQSRGVEVRSITLFIFGGVAGLARESDDAGDEFWIAIAGPIVSIVLAGLFGLAWLLFAGVSEQAAALLGYLAYRQPGSRPLQHDPRLSSRWRTGSACGALAGNT